MTVSAMALAEAELLCVSADSTFENFYETFGTEGCLLYCKQRGVLHSRFNSPADLNICQDAITKSQFQRSSKETFRQWFSLRELTKSIENGCGSCVIIQGILQHIYNPINTGLHQSNEQLRFAVSSGFEIARRDVTGATTKAQKVQLYHPRVFHTRYKWMRTTSFLHGDTTSNVSIEKVRSWLERCNTKHPDCYLVDSRLPTRLIDTAEIRRGGVQGVRLIETTLGELGTYACLSHCWGKPAINCRLTIDTLEQATQLIDYNTLPKTFRDAILLTRKLGIPYIWIDSLCIIQDGDGGKDWKVEAMKMADVYGRAYLTVAASSSADSTGGCFLPTIPDLPLSILTSTGQSRLLGARICDMQGFLQEQNDIKTRHPLFYRSWVYQERFLSRRLLKCSLGEFEYQCIKSKLCECGSYSEPISPHTAMVDSVIPARRMLLANPRRNPDLSRIWHNIVSDYTSMDMTKVTDIFPAISGCARLLARHYAKSQYFAGLWDTQLHSDLLWYNSGDPLPRTTWTAPTWSWASIATGQRVKFLEIPDRCFADNVPFHIEWTVQCVTAGSDEFGAPSDEEGDCYLESEQSLIGCSLQCLLNGKNGRPGHTRRIHAKDNADNNSCHCPWCSQIRSFKFWPDTYIQGASCDVTPVWLLPAATFIRKKLVIDVFLVLKERTAAQTYTRTGLLLRTAEKPDAQIKMGYEYQKTRKGKVRIV